MAVSVGRLLFFRHIFSLTLGQLRYANLPSVLEFAVFQVCNVRSIETVLCASCSSNTRDCERTDIFCNGPRFLGKCLLYVAVAMRLAMPDCVPDNGGPSIKTRPRGQKVNVLRALRT